MILRAYLFSVILLLLSCELETSVNVQPPPLIIANNPHYLATADGKPFFWLGDTAWLLFSKLNRQEAAQYINDRATKGYNVIQVMVLHELTVTNIYGDQALHDENVALPYVTPGSSPDDEYAYDYWDHMDYIIDLATEQGLYVALVPIWGSNVKAGGVSVDQAKAYARWLAERHKSRQNIVWLNGGDTHGDQHTDVWQAIATTIKSVSPDQLMTFHPFGRTQSSWWFHEEEWLDFNMFQSGHRRYDQDDTELGYGPDNWRYVQTDYGLHPIRPTIDGEPSYEGIPEGLHDPSQPYWEAEDLRRYAYWSVFSGAAGFTYGHSAVMQMHRPEDHSPAYGVREYWDEALAAPGAAQMIYLKNLMLSLPYYERIPDQTLIASGEGDRFEYQVATRGEKYALIYSYTGRDMRIRMGKIKGSKVKGSWYNPRNGEYTLIGDFANNGTHTFDPPGDPSEGNDWVLILESI